MAPERLPPPSSSPAPSLSQVELIGEVRRGLDAVLHAHGYQIEDCLITVGGCLESGQGVRCVAACRHDMT